MANQGYLGQNPSQAAALGYYWDGSQWKYSGQPSPYYRPGYAYGPTGTNGQNGNDYYAYQWGRVGGAAEPAAAAANEYLKYIDLTGTGLPQNQQDYLSSIGQDSGLGAIGDWQKSARNLPFSLDKQLGILQLMMNERNYRESIGLNTLQQNLAQQQLNTTGEYLQQNAGDVLRSYDTARNELNNAGQGAISGLLAREKQSIATTQQGLQSRGLGNTTIVDNARRGIQSDTNRGISQVQEDVGGMRASLAQNRAQTTQDLGSRMADFMKYRTATENNILSQRGDIIGSRRDVFQSNANNQQNNSNSSSAQTALGIFAAAAPIIAALV